MRIIEGAEPRAETRKVKPITLDPVVGQYALADMRLAYRDVNLHVVNFERQLAPLLPMERPLEPFDRHVRSNLIEAIGMLRSDGISRVDGVGFPELTSMMGKPGLGRDCSQARGVGSRNRQATLARWAASTTVHPYRYVGRAFLHTHDGRHLEPGEVIELTETQAAAWADRFEAVADAALTTAG